MNTQYFIGIAPPTDYLERVVQFQQQWMNFTDCRATRDVESTGWIDPR